MDLSGAVAAGMTAAGVFSTVRGAVIGIRGWYRRTAGSRRECENTLNRLVCGMTVQRLEVIFGPAMFRRPLGAFIKHVFVIPHAFVQVLTVSDGIVARLAVTSRDPAFKPRVKALTHGVLDVRLGESTFADSGLEPLGTRPHMGARRVSYVEWFYEGNPGAYQHFAPTYSDVSPVGGIDPGVLPDFERCGRSANDEDGVSSMDSTHARSNLRRSGKPNTPVVSGPMTGVETLLQEPVGVDLDHVRVLPLVARGQ